MTPKRFSILIFGLGLIFFVLTQVSAQEGRYRIGIAYGSSLMSKNERFEFALGRDGTDKVVIDSVNPTAYFTTKLNKGQSYAITQISGPRSCNFFGQERGTVSGADIIVTASCGTPPLAIFKLNIFGVEQGETFKFDDGYGRKASISFSTTLNIGGFPVGDTYNFRQTDGPRTCKLTNNTGTVGTALTISADCSKSGGQYRLGIAYGSNLLSTAERFEFMAGGEKVVIDHDNMLAHFPKKYSARQQYSVTQLSGPRTCNMWNQNTGTFNDQDITVSVDCGQPPLAIYKIELIGIEQGEQFRFADNYGRTLTAPFSTTVNLGGYPVGGAYSVQQIGGPRPCTMGRNQGNVTSTAPVTVKADCRKAGTATPGPSTTPANTDWELVSRSTDNKPLDTYYNPVIGGKSEDEGRYVAFGSYAKEVGGTGQYRQIVWRDRKTGVSKIISLSPSGEEGNQNSQMAAISADGKSVAFESYATNLVPGDANGRRDVFLWRFDTGRVERVSTASGGVETDYESYEPTINGDGSLVAFTSYATNIIPGIMGQSSNNVYLKDMRSGGVQIISLDEKTKKGGGGSNASISGDGSRIAFYNYSPLTKEDTNTLWDIYLWERGNPKLKRISKTAEGGDRNQGDDSTSRVVSPAISGDGRFVAYSTTATNVVSGDTNQMQDVFVVEVDTGRVVRASTGADGQQADSDSPIGQGEKLGISYDGQWVAFATKATNLGGLVMLKNIQTGKTVSVFNETGASFGQPVMSAGGSYILFFTYKQLDKKFNNGGLFVKYTGTGR